MGDAAFGRTIASGSLGTSHEGTVIRAVLVGARFGTTLRVLVSDGNLKRTAARGPRRVRLIVIMSGVESCQPRTLRRKSSGRTAELAERSVRRFGRFEDWCWTESLVACLR
jgi:hypothetical protein